MFGAVEVGGLQVFDPDRGTDPSSCSLDGWF